MMMIVFFSICGSVVVVDVQAQLTTDPSLIQQQIVVNVQNTLETTPTDEVVLLRYDQLTDLLVETAKTDEVLSQNQAAQIDYVVKGISVSIITSFWNDVLFDPNNPQRSWEDMMSLFVSSLLGSSEGYPNFLETHQQILDILNERDLFFTNRITAAYERVKDIYYMDGEDEGEVQLPPAPVYQLTYGYEHATNAKMYGFIPKNVGLVGEGRCVLMFNLGATRMISSPGDYFQIAATHETWHCFQFGLHVDLDNDQSDENDLLKLSMREGIATYLTSLSTSISEESIANNDGKFQEQDLLFWSMEEYTAAANDLKRDILIEYGKLRHETDPSILQEWMILNIPLSKVDGAPSRCAYFVAYLAIQAYVEEQQQVMEQNGGQSLSTKELLDLIETSNGREMIWQALVKKENLDDTGAGGDGDGNVSGGNGTDDIDDSSSTLALSTPSLSWTWMFLMLDAVSLLVVIVLVL